MSLSPLPLVDVLPSEENESDRLDVQVAMSVEVGGLAPAPAPAPAATPAPPPPSQAAYSATQSEILQHSITLLEMAKKRFAVDAGQSLYLYADGHYIPFGREWLHSWLADILTQTRMRGNWSRQLADRLVSWYQASSPRLWEDPPTDRICLKNGILSLPWSNQAQFLGKPTLSPHSSDWLSPIQLPIHYSPTATCPAWDQFLATIFPADCIPLAWEVIGTCLIPNRIFQEVIWLDGAGSNGKSTFLRALTSLLGQDNISAVSITDLMENRFASADLQGKLVNIDPDAEVERLRSVASLKKIVGGDRIRAERKGTQSFVFAPYCRMILAGNELPRSQDRTHGFFSRWIIVPFTKRFRRGANSGAGALEAIPQDQLLSLLSTPEERAGALNKAIEGLTAAINRGSIIIPRTVETSVREFQILRDPLFAFVEELKKEILDLATDPAPGLWGASSPAGSQTQLLSATYPEARAAGAVFISKTALYNRYKIWQATSHRSAIIPPRELYAWLERNLASACSPARWTRTSEHAIVLSGDMPTNDPRGWNVFPSRLPQVEDLGAEEETP